MIGNLGAALGIFVTGSILKSYTPDGKTDPAADGFIVCFIMYGCVYGLGVLAWLMIDPTRPIVAEEK